MNLLVEKTSVNEGLEKHVPEVKTDGEIVKVSVGEVEHPMTEWIEIREGNGKVHIKHLGSDHSPVAQFLVTQQPVKVRAYPNLHGLANGQVFLTPAGRNIRCFGALSFPYVLF